MKRIFALILSFAVLFSCLVLPAGAMFDPTPVYQVQAKSAYIVNTDTNIIVYDKDSTKQVSAGGLTKYMPIALLTLLGNTVGQLLIVRRAARNFHLIADKVADHAVVCVENEKRAESLTRGTIGDFPILATMRKTEQTVDFLRYTFSTDLADKFCRMACPIILVISIIVSIFLSILRAPSLESTLCFGLSVFPCALPPAPVHRSLWWQTCPWKMARRNSSRTRRLCSATRAWMISMM